jgi:hypothetical protein
MAMVIHQRLIHANDSWQLPIAGIPVSRFVVDYEFTIAFTDGAFDCTIRFEGTLTLVKRSTALARDVTQPGQLAELFSLLGVPAVSGTAHENGDLRVVFENGWEVLASAEPDYEAWEVSTSTGARIVCSPGGQLAIWLDAR